MIVGCAGFALERLARLLEPIGDVSFAAPAVQSANLADETHRADPVDIIVLDARKPITRRDVRLVRDTLDDDPAAHLLLLGPAGADGPDAGLLARLTADLDDDRWAMTRSDAPDAELARLIALLNSKAQLTRRLAAAEARLATPAAHDQLTGLANQTLLMDRIRTCIARQRRNDAYRFAVMAVGLDRFKVINDSLGREGGDQLIVAVAERVQHCVRETDTIARVGSAHSEELVARLGGDEFVLIIDDLARDEVVTRVALRLQHALSDPFYINGEEVFVSASIGIALGAGRAAEPDELVNDAITALNRAKADGTSKYAIFDRSMHEQAMRRLRLEADLRRALDREEFVLHYQPIVALGSAEIKGFEALIRWRPPEGDMIAPGEFIPLAEENGLIVPIGRWALSAACEQLCRWNDALPAERRISVAVNVSKRQVADPGFVPFLRELKSQHMLRPDDLHIEITESVIMDNPQHVGAVLEEIRQLGFPLHMDDFGTGYSSLSCLHHFPLSVLKIDRQFIMNMDGNEDYETIVHAIVALAHHLRMRVVAEGLETASQLRQVLATGCDYGQGYYFSKPVPAEDAWALLHVSAEWRLTA